MNKLILLIVFWMKGWGYELQENYFFENRVIYSNDLIPEVPKKFEILRIPNELNHYRINAQILIKSFELNGIEVESGRVRFVNFSQKSPVDFTPIRQQLSAAFLSRYPTMQIDEILITPRGYLDSLPKNVKALYDPKVFQNAKGTLYFFDDQNVRRYLDYSVSATIDVLHTTQKVTRKDPLSDSNTLLKPVPFDRFKDFPLTSLPSDLHRFRSTLKADVPLTARNIEAAPLVQRGEKVTVEIHNGNVSVEFGAVATQEGGLYDMITIQKNDGKRVKAKVIGERRVELL